MVVLKYRNYMILLLLVTHTIASGKEKRLLLHSEADMATELIRLRSELANVTQQLGAVVSKYANVSQQLDNALADIKYLKSTQPIIDLHQGSVYIRWGKKSCPNTTEMVYHGYTAGKHYKHKGSGANNICLPSDPTWLNYVDGIQNLRASVYGTETDIPSSPFFKYAINQQDMPCAVCRSDKSTTLMIPARKNCYPGWTLEYNGYLVGASTTLYFAYEYVCLDKEPDFLDHGASNDDQHVFHLVEGHCGSLPCPPYVNGRELACVVCSK
ncbi:uncharacterized protein LOC132717399 [Ruditapes philippinarum]|uniref:uncharacterized protein LOC132717399 n=1 Tax=Ruditapes philippinarum TaxID=129788 RepID=UPI00295B244C|nr:uncharacterized protein LOC132717399 [Ruditapes philippinarum]